MQEFLFGAVFLVVIISGIFSFFEIAFIRKFFEIKSTKYIKLLKILEILFFLMIFFSEILFIALTFLYFLVLISDFKKKIISKEELIINTLFYWYIINNFGNVVNFRKSSKYLGVYELKIKIIYFFIWKRAVIFLIILISIKIIFLF